MLLFFCFHSSWKLRLITTENLWLFWKVFCQPSRHSKVILHANKCFLLKVFPERMAGWFLCIFCPFKQTFPVRHKGNVPFRYAAKSYLEDKKSFLFTFPSLRKETTTVLLNCITLFPFLNNFWKISICQLQDLLEMHNGGPNIKDYSCGFST